MISTLLVLIALISGGAQEVRKPEATSLLGVPLFPPPLSADARATLEKNLAAAQAEFDKNPNSADAAIWVGRRTSYLGRYQDAIEVYSAAVARHPSEPRLYR
ncbi:MAG: hypothetical protein H0W08_06185, partial [Acidobacteria bacterium]|nr:hypothetical protein [Acidobacteriota bacterium]